ncbi:MAG: LPXTG cell wall anchor domain-containing protein [Clostridium sp.]|uniref:LPXTG cell wall anchor domain-containing protein n=1 Tax=Clostridium sp. TaxID=1506 RepID=UPI00290F364C|nr:LPXTG cell wall anchor domain-containing protein [Clostridium sp.]MDU5111467.1 LPXTG cell wall anchor domain-containing protein [Clostridium sp.]
MLLKKVLSRFFYFIILAMLIVNFNEATTYALSGEIIIETINGDNRGVFNKEKDGLWAPGNTKVSEFIVYNNSDTDIKLDNISFSKRLDYVVDKNNIVIKNSTTKIYEEEGNSLYEGNIEGLINKSEKIDEDIIIKSGDNKKFIMTMSITENLGNEGQGIEENLDFLINYTRINNEFNKTLPKTGNGSEQLIFLLLGNFLVIGGILILKLKRV